jgi:hypothetical protein
MSGYYGRKKAGSTVYLPLYTYNGAGASVTCTGFSAANIKIYKNGGTTERSSSAGITATIDFDSRTGLHMAVIDLSDNTDAGFYAAGSNYHAVATGLTVDSQSVIADLGSWDIDAADIDTVAGYIDTEVAAIKAKTDNLPASPAATGDIPSAATVAAAVLTTAMTESYAADGVAPTLTQALMLALQHLSESSISGTTKTVKKLDGSTTAATFTLNDATTPTSITRAS